MRILCSRESYMQDRGLGLYPFLLCVLSVVIFPLHCLIKRTVVRMILLVQDQCDAPALFSKEL